jgi:DNA-binding CsgD family transcriptional regulator
MTGHPPIGRQRELAMVEAFLGAIATGAPSALAITGSAGIGKTTVWRDAVRMAREQGLRVLVAEPSGSEATFSYSGLADLLRTVPDELLATLPGVQRESLDAALLRGAAASPGHGARAVATAVLSIITDLAAQTGVIIAVEDAQWLDVATADALSYAARRIDNLPFGVLVSVRSEATRPDTFDLALSAERRIDLVLGPLTTAVIHDVIARELGLSLPRPAVVQIATASGGNPMYALEIAREVERTGLPAPGVALRANDQLRNLIASRVERLPAPTRGALLVAASLSRPTTALVDEQALEPAERRGIVEIDGQGRIRFSHPLLAAAVYESASIARRRAVHRDLASKVADDEERARHLGLAAAGPDETVAAQLDAAAEHAAARGATAAACELGRRALELTEDPRSLAAVNRTRSLARHLIDVGQTQEAKILLESLLELDLSGDLLADVERRMGEMLWFEREFESGYAHVVAALASARDPMLIAKIHNQAAWVSEPVDLERGMRHEEAVLELLPPGPGPYAYALAYLAYQRLIHGDGADQGAVDRALSLGPAPDRDDASPVPLVWPMFMDDFDLARERFLGAVDDATAYGEETSLQTFLGHLAAIELWTGHWRPADAYASQAVAVTERIESPAYLGSALFARGLVDAHLGRMDEARLAGSQIVALFDPSAEPQLVFGHWLLGLVAFFALEFADADRHFSVAARLVDAMGQREPVRMRFHPDHLEAVIAIGDLDRADALLARLDERARAFPRPWILATSARCRGLLFAARGDTDAALAALNDALEHHGRLAMPFERARTQLVLGQLLRRRRAKSEARAVLGEALAEFERLGAPLWVARTRAELGRIPVRRSSDELSATEAQIARLAAGGLTNREIAERAFVSPKTVEANIARIYRKLDIRSRAELGRAMAQQAASTET